MVLQLRNDLIIDNVRHYPDQTVGQLRTLLAKGVPAQPDPHRHNFFELEAGSQVFYVSIPPGGGKVLLLATWHKDSPLPDPVDRAAD